MTDLEKLAQVTGGAMKTCATCNCKALPWKGLPWCKKHMLKLARLMKKIGLVVAEP